MSDVDLLRRAAALMRERAQAASAGREDWERRVTGDLKCQMPHLVGMSPAVALAVADWLDASIPLTFAENPGLMLGFNYAPASKAALALARAYIGQENGGESASNGFLTPRNVSEPSHKEDA